MILTVTLNPTFDALIHIEHLQWRAKNIVQDKHVVPSGKGFNVSRVLAVLGLPTTALGFLGRADIATYTAALEPLGVTLDVTSIAATRTNLKIIEIDTGYETEINERGVAVMDAELAAFRETFHAQLPQAEWVVMSGSVAPNIPTTIYAELGRAAARAGAHTLLDSSGEFLLAGVVAVPYILRINGAELAELAGREFDSLTAMADAADEVRARGSAAVIVSLGEEGALLVHSTGRWIARPPQLHAINAIGAGDVMSAGLVDAWQRGLTPPDALRWATALASASVLMLETSALDLATARELEARIEVNKI